MRVIYLNLLLEIAEGYSGDVDGGVVLVKLRTSMEMVRRNNFPGFVPFGEVPRFVKRSGTVTQEIQGKYTTSYNWQAGAFSLIHHLT